MEHLIFDFRLIKIYLYSILAFLREFGNKKHNCQTNSAFFTINHKYIYMVYTSKYIRAYIRPLQYFYDTCYIVNTLFGITNAKVDNYKFASKLFDLHTCMCTRVSQKY